MFSAFGNPHGMQLINRQPWQPSPNLTLNADRPTAPLLSSLQAWPYGGRLAPR